MRTTRKHILWDHYVAETFINNSLPNGVTRNRLAKAKSKILADEHLWQDQATHGLEEMHPVELRLQDPYAYVHATSNFWGEIVRIVFTPEP